MRGQDDGAGSGGCGDTALMQDYRRLNVWVKAERLALEVINALPPSACRRVPGLRSQAIRAATAIPDLIAEGCGKQARIELARFCDMGLGSAAELRNHILRATRSGIIARETAQKLDGMIDEVRRMLTGLSQAVRREVDRDLRRWRQYPDHPTLPPDYPTT